MTRTAWGWLVCASVAASAGLVPPLGAAGARAAQAFGPGPPIVTEYDARRDTTIVKFQFGEDDHRLWSPTGSLPGIEFDVRYTYRGRTPQRLPDVVNLSVATQRNAPPPNERQELTLVADGRPIRLTPFPDVSAKSGDQYFFEGSATIARGELQRLIAAARAEGSWLGIKFVFTEYQQGFLKPFVTLEYPP